MNLDTTYSISSCRTIHSCCVSIIYVNVSTLYARRLGEKKKPQTEMNEHPHLVTKNRKYNNSKLVAIETKSAICGISSLLEDIFQAR